jgi:hypothetical protein
MKSGYIPKEQRKKILLLSDDLRMPSGVGVMSKEIVSGTAHRYNWVQLGAAVVHPEQGQIMDASESLNQQIGIEDSYLRIYPYSGYGDAAVIRNLMMMEQPDAILHFTDPRYWIWLYHLEREIREHMPIMFYHVWDDLPYPKYNRNYYRSCDSIFSISRQTHNIVHQVWPEGKESWQTKYIPHGINQNDFFKHEKDEDKARAEELKKKLFGTTDVDFVVTYNNRNIRRKMTSDVILAFNEFTKILSPEQKARVRLLMHTQPIDENGTDLPRVINDLTPGLPVAFSTDRLETQGINDIYNISDLVINLASNEGFGLGTMEALMAERMICVNVTGGLQDQCGFVETDGHDARFINESDYCAEWGSNADGRFKECGEWALPVFPVSRSLNGSPPTPYIFDDRCSWMDAAERIKEAYAMGKEERERRGRLGRQYALGNGFSADAMCERFIEGIDDTLANWKPRKRFELVKL